MRTCRAASCEIPIYGKFVYNGERVSLSWTVAVPHPDHPTTSLTFSGHETFVLRAHWLKKAYDLVRDDPALFQREDAFVRLGVGRNMAQSIRHWARACGMLDDAAPAGVSRPSALAHLLFDDAAGLDPFLVTPAAAWLLHWQISSRPAAAFSWYATFNVWRGAEFTADALADAIGQAARDYPGRVPSPATLRRDVDCLLRSYVRQDRAAPDDALLCPLHDLRLVRALPATDRYHLTSAARPTLPDGLLALAIRRYVHNKGRTFASYAELSYGAGSPGRIFGLGEDSLAARLWHLDGATGGLVRASESAGVRQVVCAQVGDALLDDDLLRAAFREVR